LALKPCRECGKEVSTEAKSCPHCGVTSPVRKSQIVVLGCLASLLLVGYCVVNLVNTTTSSVSTSARTASQSQPEPLQAGNWKWERGEFGNLYIVGTVKNQSSKQYSYVQVQFNLYDAAGAQVGSAMANVNNLESFGTWRYRAIVMDDEHVRSARLKGVSGF
jgi:hypothetical protein